jgi:hypothetical protein
MRPGLTALLLLPLIAASLACQQRRPDSHGAQTGVENGGALPPGWSARPDDGGKPTAISLVAMPPGWHLTTATSGILYRSQDSASGGYEVTAKLHLFPSQGSHQEAFGLFIGGRDLDGVGQRYSYFLIRGDGAYKIKRRSGASAIDVTRDWTPAPAIVKLAGTESVANLLSVAVGKDKVTFLVNGQEVYSAPAAGLDTEGIVGLRVNHNLSLHVETLEIRK